MFRLLFRPEKTLRGSAISFGNLLSLVTSRLVVFFLPYNLHPPCIPTNPPGRPTPEGLISVHFGSVYVHFGPVWLRFGVRFGSVFQGVCPLKGFF